jgi:hypothetical protein
MKIIKAAFLFYNSILIICLVTVGLATNSYQDLAPTLLLLPVGVYFILSFINRLTKFSYLIKKPGFKHLIKVLRSYSMMVVVLLILASLAASSSLAQAGLTMVFLPLIVSFLFDFFGQDKKKTASAKLLNLRERIIKKNQQLELKSKLKEEIEVKKTQQLSQDLPADPDMSESAVTISQTDNSDLAEEGLVGEEVEDLLEIKDRKRRQFLKIVGGGGVSLFFMLFFMPGKAEAAFFGSSPGPGVVAIKDSSGTKIDPAEKQPTDGYNISEIDDATSPSYYGFVHKNGPWYIAKEDSAGAYRYISGSSNFSTSWTARAGLEYDYFDSIF